MAINDDESGRGFSLKRWSRRKLEAARAVDRAPVAEAQAAAPPPAIAEAPSRVAQANAATPAPAEALPPVESLSFESDYTAFLKPDVDESLKRKALAKLFGDPRFNVMDGLDVYIDDYSKPDPIPPEMLRELAHCRSIFDPPRTRVNTHGYVEDIPPEEIAAEAQAGATPSEDPSAKPPAVATPEAPAIADGELADGSENARSLATQPAAVPAPTQDAAVPAQPLNSKAKPSAA